MDLGLDGKVALITGGSKGIGRACAERLAEEGCEVLVVARTAGDLEQARGAIGEASGRRVRSARPTCARRKAARPRSAR